MSSNEKFKKLESLFHEMDRVAVAFSGGVDSTLVLAVARRVLGDGVLAVTAQSPSLPQRELQSTKIIAQTLGAEHLIIQTAELTNPQYASNPVNRCYHCKSELYDRLQKVIAQRNISFMVNGTNVDDLGDHRPGLQAAQEANVRSPLCEAGFSKQEVREWSRILNLPTWDKPAMPCLSSRIPYGQPVTLEKLSMIEQAEDFLISLGYRQLRVRHHGDMARIELPLEDLAGFFSAGHAAAAQSRLKQIGFQFVTVDMQGFRSGSLNEVLNATDRKGFAHVSF